LNHATNYRWHVAGKTPKGFDMKLSWLTTFLAALLLGATPVLMVGCGEKDASDVVDDTVEGAEDVAEDGAEAIEDGADATGDAIHDATH